MTDRDQPQYVAVLERAIPVADHTDTLTKLIAPDDTVNSVMEWAIKASKNCACVRLEITKAE